MKYHEMRDHVIALDELLTGKSYEECSRMYDSQIKEEEDLWYCTEYYLSDGGYSRLSLDPAEVTVSITYRSSARAKEAFCRPVVSRLTRVLIEAICFHLTYVERDDS